MRRLALFVLPPALIACGSSKESAAVAAPPKLAVTIQAPTHRPKVNAPWRYKVLVTSKGKPVAARIRIQVLFHGVAVGKIGTHLVPHGRWAETIRWPASSRGQPLVFSVRATSSGRTATTGYPIRVQ